jgi:hypothetical protein
MRAEGPRHAENDTGLQPVILLAIFTHGYAMGYDDTGPWPVLTTANTAGTAGNLGFRQEASVGEGFEARGNTP